ncbi:PTS sugar transporter subunit IIA [Lactobacillus sp. ESL0791]|uniref:PTS sugar transporter subunit IIA n=1 Tax=Lactobacillus sp. ESL0791 TaxID=2983234 RepID=UPI0023F86388|nr:PTS sugar transporter subunit IIA [Lactobacillus sp. ESL0791]MDF7638336.1 PTS sugar transporter subunit IIA [Lactobacillus sp. ESL0791]
MNAINISKVLDENTVTLNLKSRTKEGVINELAQLLKENGKLESQKEFVKDVFYRETEGITGLGQGIAIPHGKSKAVLETSLAIGISNQPIKWESLDNQPVTVIILFAVRDEDANVLHLKLLQHVAILLADDDFVKKLHEVKSKTELINMFK